MTAVDKAATQGNLGPNAESHNNNFPGEVRDFDGFASASKVGSISNVSIIVCVYNQAQMLRLCLEQIASFSPEKSEIVVVNDASTEREVEFVLDHFEKVFESQLRIIRNEQNLGYTKSANIGAKAASDNHDLVFLNSDAFISSRTIQTLQVVAESDRAIATVSPVSDNAGVFTVSSTSMPNYSSSEKLFSFSESFRRQDNELFTYVPTTNGFCMFIKRSVWIELGGFDEDLFPRGYGEENDFCLRASNLGYRHALTSKAFVFHRKSQSFGKQSSKLKKTARSVLEQKWPNYSSMIKGFGRPYLDSINARPPEEVLRRRILLVMPIVSGGAAQTNHELFTALSLKFDVFVLQARPNKTLIWQIKDQVSSKPETLDFNGVEAFLGSGNKKYDSAFLSLLVNLSIDAVHVAHLAWQSNNISKIAKDFGVPVSYTFHDFESACPTVFLTNSKMQFCGGNCNSVDSGCSPALETIDRFPTLWNSQVFEWREKRQQFLKYVDVFFAPSEFAIRTLADIFPEITSKTRLMPHVLKTDIQSVDNIFIEGAPKKILVLGKMAALKGRSVVQELANLLEGSVEFHHLGGQGFPPDSGIKSHGTYAPEELSNRVSQINPSAALIPSLQPETFSRVLSECTALGIPVIVPKMGALGERVMEQKIGATYNPNSQTDEIAKKILSLLSTSDWHRTAISNLKSHRGLVAGAKPFEEWVVKYEEIFVQLTSPKKVVE